MVDKGNVIYIYICIYICVCVCVCVCVSAYIDWEKLISLRDLKTNS